MANSQSTTNGPSSRPPSSRIVSETQTSGPAIDPPSPATIPHDCELAETQRICGALGELIETERARLMTADSVLACVQIALDPEALAIDKPPFFPDVVNVARELVNKSIRRLDSIHLGSVLRGTGRGAP